MAIPKDFHNDELGALLIAIGSVMVENSLLFGAVLDGESRDAIAEHVYQTLEENISLDRAHEIAGLTENELLAALDYRSIPTN